MNANNIPGPRPISSPFYSFREVAGSSDASHDAISSPRISHRNFRSLLPRRRFLTEASKTPEQSPPPRPRPQPPIKVSGRSFSFDFDYSDLLFFLLTFKSPQSKGTSATNINIHQFARPPDKSTAKSKQKAKGIG